MDKLERENGKRILNLWRSDPKLFARDVFGFVPDKLQGRLFDEVSKIFNSKCKFMRNEVLSDEEIEYCKKRGVAVMSGKGTGKTSSFAILAYWFLLCNYQSKIPVTGPSYDQIKDIFMSEMNKWYTRCKLRSCLCVQNDSIFVKNGESLIKHWFLKLRTTCKAATAEQQGNTLSGWHEDYLLIIADEASDVPDPVFSKFDTTLTGPVNFVLLGFNPTRTSGFAYNTHYGDTKDKWIKLQWDARESGHVTKQQLEDMKETYGENSNEYRISVLGLPPTVEKDSLIPIEWINSSVDRYYEVEESQLRRKENDVVVAGIDIAREGNDKTSLIIKCNSRVEKIIRYNEADSISNADRIIEYLREYRVNFAAIDSIGVGGPVYDYIKRYFPNIRPVDNHRLASNKQNFPLLRDELWWSFRELFQNGLIDIPNDRSLINELSNIRYGMDSKGRIKIESKRDIKSRGCSSPDTADAIVVTLVLKNILTKGDNYAYKDSVVKKPHSWMSC